MTAESIKRTLEPREAEQATADTEKKQAIAGVFSSYMERAVELRRRETQKEEEAQHDSA